MDRETDKNILFKNIKLAFFLLTAPPMMIPTKNNKQQGGVVSALTTPVPHVTVLSSFDLSYY